MKLTTVMIYSRICSRRDHYDVAGAVRVTRSGPCVSRSYCPDTADRSPPPNRHGFYDHLSPYMHVDNIASMQKCQRSETLSGQRKQYAMSYVFAV